MNQKNILRINDSVYNALTGELISGPKIEKQIVAVKIKQARERAQHTKAHAQQKSKTLMRSAVKKPNINASTTNINKSLPISSMQALEKKLWASSVDESRMLSAKRTQKHPKIKKFEAINNVRSSEVSSGPTTQPVASKLKKRPTSTEDLLMHAVALAKSHENTYQATSNKRFSSISKKASLVTAGVAVFALLSLSLIPQAQLKMASSQAGFNVSKPQYQPAGFAFKGVEASAGQASLVYKSNSDDRKITVTEKTTNWNTDLLSGVLAMTSENNQIVTPKGRDVFIGKKGNATWINNGIQYEIKSAGALSNKQITQIVDSL